MSPTLIPERWMVNNSTVHAAVLVGGRWRSLCPYVRGHDDGTYPEAVQLDQLDRYAIERGCAHCAARVHDVAGAFLLAAGMPRS